MNTTPMFFAPDAAHTLAGAEAREGGIKGFLKLAAKVATGQLDFGDTRRMLKGGQETRTKDISVAAHTFWSRVPFKLGDHAVKFRLIPADDVSPALPAKGPDQLKNDIESRLANGPVKYKLQIQGFRDPQTTPMEDTRVVWDTPFVTVAELTLPQIDPKRSAGDVQRVKDEVEQLAFSPFHTWDEKFLEPLGEINAIRKEAYNESSKNRGVDPAKRRRCPLGFG
jgi:catalase